MAIKKLTGIGIAPNLLLRDVEVTAPWIFKGELETSKPEQSYLSKLISHRKNLNGLKLLDLTEYFRLCMASHWATAGTFVPTNVDNQIREGLWKHNDILGHIENMAQITIDSWRWDYQQVTNRKSYNPKNNQIMSTHEGTWLSVAIGAYNALQKHKKTSLQNDMAEVILAEIAKEEELLLQLREDRDHINFLRSTALMAHNFGDLDRVIDQWSMPHDDPFRLKIYKLGHEVHSDYSPILAFAGQVNKQFLSVENHRHMSMRQAKCLRRSNQFLIPVGPFMDEWGKTLGSSTLLSLAEKGEIVAALNEGYGRQDQAFGYTRAYHGLIHALPNGLETLVADLPFDLMLELKKGKFAKTAELSQEEFETSMIQKLESFKCPLTGLVF